MKDLNTVLTEVADNKGIVRFPFMENEEIRNLPIDTLNLDVRSFNGLKRNNIETIGDLIDKSHLINTFRNLGKKSCGKIMYALCCYQYSIITDKKKYLMKIVELNKK